MPSSTWSASALRGLDRLASRWSRRDRYLGRDLPDRAATGVFVPRPTALPARRPRPDRARHVDCHASRSPRRPVPSRRHGPCCSLRGTTYAQSRPYHGRVGAPHPSRRVTSASHARCSHARCAAAGSGPFPAVRLLRDERPPPASPPQPARRTASRPFVKADGVGAIWRRPPWRVTGRRGSQDTSRGTRSGNGGTLSTGGNLVFWGSGDRLIALDARSGAELWGHQVGQGLADPGQLRARRSPVRDGHGRSGHGAHGTEGVDVQAAVEPGGRRGRRGS